MTKKPKLEIFILRLNPTPFQEDYTFRNFFKDFYDEKKSARYNLTDLDLQTFFFSGNVR